MGSPATIIPMLLLPLTIIVGGLAVWLGRTAERMAGAALLSTLVLQVLVMAVVGPQLGMSRNTLGAILDVAISLTLGLVFLWAALKHNSRWLGFAFFVQGVELTISAYFLGPDVPLKPATYFKLLNVMTFLTVTLLAIATAQAFLRRRRESRVSESQLE